MNNQTNHTEPEGEALRSSSRTGFLQKLSSVAVGVALLAMMVVAGCDSGGEDPPEDNGDNGGATVSVDTFYISDARPSLDAGGEVQFTYSVSVEGGDLESGTLDFNNDNEIDVSAGENQTTDFQSYAEGSYTAEILLDGESEGTVDFEVVGTDTELIEDFEDYENNPNVRVDIFSLDGDIDEGTEASVESSVNEDGQYEMVFENVDGSFPAYQFVRYDENGEAIGEGDGFEIAERPTVQLDISVSDAETPHYVRLGLYGAEVEVQNHNDPVMAEVPAVDVMQSYYFDYSEETGTGFMTYGEGDELQEVPEEDVDDSIVNLRYNFHDDNVGPENREPWSGTVTVDNLALHTSTNPLAEWTPPQEEE